MNARALLLLAGIAVIAEACGPPDDRSRRRRAGPEDRTDTSIPMDIRPAFEVPAWWEPVKLPNGMEFSQPPGFTVVNAPAVNCDEGTQPAEVPVLQLSLSNRWPLTLSMRRGDLSQIARANGFTIDSTDIAAHDQQPGDTTFVRRGEGWMLLSGRSSAARSDVLFASVRAPQGCYLLWAARGIDIDEDTLGLVLGTVRFGAAPQ